MAVQAKWRTQDCPQCGTQLLSFATALTGGVEIGSPLIVCPKCGKTSYTKMRREWYNYPNKDLLFFIPLVMAVGIYAIAGSEFGPLGKVMGAIVLAISVGCGIFEAISIAKSKRRMRDPEYLSELLRWQIIRQEEYEAFMRDAQE